MKPLTLVRRKAMCKTVDRWWKRETNYQKRVMSEVDLSAFDMSGHRRYVEKKNKEVERIKTHIMKNKLKLAYNIVSGWDTSVKDGFPQSIWNLFMKLED